MSALRWLLALTAAVLLAPAVATAQDPPKDPPKSSAAKPGDDPPVVTRGQLPPNWRALSLTDEQKTKVYSVQGKYRGRIADLERQIRDLRAEERKEVEKVLTAAQKARLKEIMAGKAPGGDDKPPPK
jgi:Spy/CpxP family protein refolding chaperone